MRGGPIIAAGIVTFEPDLARLEQNLECIASQVHALVVVDNGSSNADAVQELVDGISCASLIRSSTNEGIAAALNRAASWMRSRDHDWLVTLDQDSVAPPGMVAELSSVAEQESAALVTPFIVDRNKLSVADYRRLALPQFDEYRQAARRGAITSGALMHLPTFFEVGGFDERFFIDYVDYDLNQRLLLASHRILRANRTFLLHEVGKARETWLRVPRKDVDGKWRLERFWSFGHSADRCYYKGRNRVLFTRKYGRRIGITHEGVWQIPQQVVLTVAFESGRMHKLKSFLRGIRDGARIRLT